MTWSYDAEEGLVERYRSQDVWRNQTVYQSAVERASSSPKATVFLGTCPVAIEEVVGSADALAVGLWQAGIRPGQVISFQLPNWAEAAVVNLAACRLGLIVNPIVPIYRDAELSFMLADCESTALILPGTFRGVDFALMAKRLRDSLSAGLKIITVRADSGGDLRLEDLIAAGRGGTVAWPQVSAESVKLRLYTSGTTGRPKAVLHSHNTLARSVAASMKTWSLGAGDVILMPSPVTHVTGYSNGLELPFLHGTRTVLMERWDADAAVRLIDEHRANATIGATPFLRELTAAALRAGSTLASLRVFACGGAVVEPRLIHAANAAFETKPAFRVYGSSEAPYVSLGFPASVDADLAARTDGRVVDYQVRVVDDAGLELADGQEGELLVRGPSLFLGYALESDNANAFADGGFFRTGDIGKFDGVTVSITGRKKDLIIRGGENISAREIEDVLQKHPAIIEAAVVAMPHERLGEGICACVILQENMWVDLAELMAFVADAGLARQKSPERLEIMPDFPRTPSGKIRKDVLRAMVAGGAAITKSSD